MDAASTGRQVRKLEELGFVDRVPGEADARVVVVVEITPAGTTHVGGSPTCSTGTSATCSSGGRPTTVARAR